MTRHRLWSTLALLTTLTLVLAACGAPAPATPAAESTSAPVAAPTSAPAAEATSAPVAEATEAAAAATNAPAEPAAAEAGGAKPLPADAAPPEQQVYVVHFDNTADFTTVDLYESVYKRGGAPTELLSEFARAPG